MLMSGTYIDKEIELSTGSARVIQCVSMPASGMRTRVCIHWTYINAGKVWKPTCNQSL